MAKTATAPFAQTTKTETAVVTAAVGSINTSAPTNTSLIVTAGVEGALVTAISAIPRATATDNALYVFISKDSGATKELIGSVLLGAHTVATTTAIPVTKFSDVTESTPIRLEAGDQLYVGTGVALAGGITFKAEWTDF